MQADEIKNTSTSRSMRFNKLISGVLLGLSLVRAGAATDSAALEKHTQNYSKNAKAILEMAITKKIDATVVEKHVRECLADASWAAEEYGKAFPAGAKLLKTVVASIPAMEKLDFKSLETEWHDLGYFSKPGNDPGVDLKEESNEHFTDPIHSIVHPLLVLKAAQNYAVSKGEDDLKAVKEEMEEGLEQMDRLKKQLAEKK
ncbi:MAG: hypothetical protein JNN07_05935 [Verrucomicrobiales bacterium]|nr:hypothetical protein [Verrucomicrobiales bacterium]